MIDFRSDNTCAVHPHVMQALVNANQASASSYGADTYSDTLKERLSELFEKEVYVWLTNTGTAANSLALSALTKPFHSIFCHASSHINTDECAASQLFTGGACLHPLESRDGKLPVSVLQPLIDHATAMRPHASIPGCLSITQSTECGTVYSLAELQEIAAFAQKNHLPIHMDGARFANALAHLNCSPAEMTWKSGVDVLSLGGTKNGALLAEAIVFFNPKFIEDFDFRHKRVGQLMSKTRFIACQWLALLEDNLWLKNAAHANHMAQQVAQIFQQFNLHPHWSVDANEVFVTLPKHVADALMALDVKFYDWYSPTNDLYRFVTSCFTSEHDMNTFKEHLKTCCEQAYHS
ncbi:MAG: low specificity L-threonine aldolase [Gammaproteobacteria bacterium]|nr:low specificity L-threonine aldolase [Gammaproteobacteria bacterium]